MGHDLTARLSEASAVANRLAHVQAERDALAGPLEDLTHEYSPGLYGGCTLCGTTQGLPVHQTPATVYAALARQNKRGDDR